MVGKAKDLVETLLKAKGFDDLNPLQKLALERGLLDTDENIVVSAPTASGKSLIGELALLKTLEDGRKGVWLCPLRALANEKYSELGYLRELGYEIGISTGDYDTSGEELANKDVVVTTNEKFDSLIRNSAPWIPEVGLVIADEIHMLTEPKRGPVLDVVLTRLMAMRNRPRIIALSATISNSREIAEWLDAIEIRSDWRPVELVECVAYPKDGSTILRCLGDFETVIEGKDPMISVIEKTLREGGQALVFLSSRRSAESLARKLSKKLGDLGSEESRELARRIKDLARDPHIESTLPPLVERGFAYHHAGLPGEVRILVENGFREFVLKVICATTTLAAGLNLPARTVVIRDTRRYDPDEGIYGEIPVYEYKQMAGRAGRPKYDRIGYSVLLAKSEKEAEYLIERYILAEPERIVSYILDVRNLPSSILAVIREGFASRIDELVKFFRKTFGGKFVEEWLLRSSIEEFVSHMISGELLTEVSGRLKVTELGSITVSLYIHPYTSIKLSSFLEQARTEVEILFLISSTFDMRDTPPFSIGRDRNALLRELGDLIQRFSMPPFDDPYDLLRAAKRTLILRDWINGVEQEEISEKWGIRAGDLRRLVESAEWVSHAAAKIASYLGIERKLVRELPTRIEYGIRREFLELVSIPEIGRARAEKLWESGFRSLEDIARASIEDLLEVEGIGRALAEKIKRYAEELLALRRRRVERVQKTLQDFL